MREFIPKNDHSHTSVGRKFAPVEGLSHDLVCTGSIYHVHFAWQVWHGQLSPRFKFNKLKSFSGVEIDQNHVDKRILRGKGFAVGRVKRHNFCPASVYSHSRHKELEQKTRRYTWIHNRTGLFIYKYYWLVEREFSLGKIQPPQTLGGCLIHTVLSLKPPKNGITITTAFLLALTKIPKSPLKY